MGSSEKRQSPRYTLRPENIQVGRFSKFNWFRSKKVLNTIIYDLSKSGMSFIVPFYQAPKVGDKIGIEFTIPGGEQIACLGTVMSVSDAGHLRTYFKQVDKFPHVKVGIKFESLPPKYEAILEKNLKRVISKAELDRQLQELGFVFKASVDSVPYPVFIAIMSVVAVIAMGMFVGKMANIAQSKWWIKEAKSFSSHMQQEHYKDVSKGKSK